MLVKDLLILFQAGNEGVINLLGQYPSLRTIRHTDPAGQNTILKCRISTPRTL
jgi:hypothetical protein